MHCAECRLTPLATTSVPAARLTAQHEGTTALHRNRAALVVAAAALVVGTAAAAYYAAAGLSLAHYDARAHLVVARRVIDSLTPGWQQVGAVWLPLPHLLNMVPVQIDALYRSGASAIAISVLSMALACWAMSFTIVRVTGSTSGAVAASGLLLLNPNVLYLQSTPMTEPLLLGVALAGVALTIDWIERGRPWPIAAGLVLAAACLTRYEAWPVTAAVIVLACAARIRRGSSVRASLVGCLRLALFPSLAVALFLVNSRWKVGAWFVSGGFFVPENTAALDHPIVAYQQVSEGLHRLSGTALVWSGYAGAVLTIVAFARSLSRSALIVVLSLAAAAALPWMAYLQGHPFRVRYDVPLLAACSALGGVGIGLLWRRAQPIAAAAVLAAALVQAHPLDQTAPLIIESQLDARNGAGRQAVTTYLVQHYDRRGVMMSMGSLGHYMQDLSRSGFRIHDFLHEGNGDLWNFAMTSPRVVVGWIVIEEKAEGGDALSLAARRDPKFLEGFTRVAEGGGVALYRSASTR
jgi:hypothetical protein